MTLDLTKPQIQDLPSIKEILSQWNDESETQKYFQRIENVIKGQIEFDMKFWVLKDEKKVLGIGGLSNCQPKLKPFIQTNNPKELKTIFLNQAFRGKGFGRKLVELLQSKSLSLGYKELLLVSAEKYRETAYGFYLNLGFKQLGEVEGGEVGEKMAVFSKLLTK